MGFPWGDCEKSDVMICPVCGSDQVYYHHPTMHAACKECKNEFKYQTATPMWTFEALEDLKVMHGIDLHPIKETKSVEHVSDMTDDLPDEQYIGKFKVKTDVTTTVAKSAEVDAPKPAHLPDKEYEYRFLDI